jgi:hypothetical protein
MASFFTTYILLRALTGFPLHLLRLPAIITYAIFRAIAKTPRAKLQAEDPEEFDYGH